MANKGIYPQYLAVIVTITAAVTLGLILFFPLQSLQHHPFFKLSEHTREKVRVESLAFQLSIDRQLDNGHILFFGDSQIRGLCTSCIAPGGINFGLGHDTTRGLLSRLPLYGSLSTSDAVVVWIGINDLIAGVSLESINQNMLRILRSLEIVDRVFVLSIHETNQQASNYPPGLNAEISATNQSFSMICESTKNCVYLDTMNGVEAHCGATVRVLTADGLHFSEIGYRCLSEYLQSEVLSSLTNRQKEPVN